MTDGDRQSGDGRGGGLSIFFPFLFLSQINGSQITLSKLPHLCKLRAATDVTMVCNVTQGSAGIFRMEWGKKI